MSLLPRYSLLTLLILTALVAGGVKLWYGPHHVIQRVSPSQEEEYTYTRDWRGNKLEQGPVVIRTFDREGKVAHVEIYFRREGKTIYYRNNELMAISYSISKRSGLPATAFQKSLPDVSLSPEELLALQQVVERERTRFRESHPSVELWEGYCPEFFPELE